MVAVLNALCECCYDLATNWMCGGLRPEYCWVCGGKLTFSTNSFFTNPQVVPVEVNAAWRLGGVEAALILVPVRPVPKEG